MQRDSSYLSLQHGFELAGSWQKTWFDSSRQQTLLFDGLSYWLWAPWVTIGWDKPVFYYKNPKLPQLVSFARVSLDSHLIAIQTDSTGITVVDISSDRQWQIDIKASSENEILHHGIIWSEHGGNSQDLVVLTSRGVELWKVSPARGQCRLSRFISVKAKCFWYEPNFRTVLIANYQHSSRLNLHKQTIDLSGFILKADISEGPKLELPAPDKIPVFSLGPGIKPEHIFLTSLYGQLYCAAYISSDMASVVRLYSLSKQAVLHKFSLTANISGPIVFSTLDNLLCCHYFDFNVSVFYDIMDLRQAETAAATAAAPMRGAAGAGVRVGDPYCAASPITCVEFSFAAPESSTGKHTPVRQKSATNTPINSNSNSGIAASSSPSVWDAVDSAGSAGDAVDVLRISVGNASLTDSDHGILDPTTRDGTYGGTPSLQLKKISDLLFYADGPLVFDTKRNTMWRLKCELTAVVSTSAPQWRCVEFLARRGQAPAAPKPIHGPDHDVGGEAKRVLLEHIKACLEAKTSFDSFRALMQPIVRIYTSEFLRLHNDGYLEPSEPRASIEVPRGPNDKNQSNAKVKNWLGGFEQRNDHPGEHVVDERRIRLSISPLDSRGRMLHDPLEAPISPHLLRYEICTALRIESHPFRDRSASRDVTGGTAAEATPSVSLPKQGSDLLVPLNTRRGADGLLVVSQMELLCHVWIPLLYLWREEDLVYFSRVLTLYIAELQSISPAVGVESALSLLLFKILAVRQNYLEAARLMQIQFFSDSVELAVEAFELAQLSASGSCSASPDPAVGQNNVSNVCNVLRQSAFDMLWRLNEITTAVRRLLEFGLLVDAISLCTKSKGTWRRGLSPASIPGIDFYRAGVLAMRGLDSLSGCTNGGSEDISALIEQRKCALFSVLFSFIADWDNGLLAHVDEVSGDPSLLCYAMICCALPCYAILCYDMI
jgi:hypothetical protein